MTEKTNPIEDMKYLLVGKYIVAFEHLVNSMRVFSRGIILVSSSGRPNIHVANSVVVDLAAYQMSCMAERLFFSFFHGIDFSSDVKRNITNTFKEIQQVIEKRNLFVHGLWLIDSHYGQGANEETMTYMKDKRKRDGVEIVSEGFALKDFESMIIDCKNLAKKVDLLSDIICSEKSIDTMANSIKRLYVGS